MTCVVGLVDDGKVYMGADSCSISADYDAHADRMPKLFRVGDALIGFTSSWRMGQILAYHLELETPQDEDTRAYMVKTFIPAVRKVLKEHGYAEVKDNAESIGRFLVGIKGRLFQIQEDLALLERGQFDAIGCGSKYALGAMTVMNGEPRQKIHKALYAASTLNVGVMPPMLIEVLE